MVHGLGYVQSLGSESPFTTWYQYTLICILHVMQAELVLLETTECTEYTYSQSPTIPKTMVPNIIEKRRSEAAHMYRLLSL